MSVEIESHQWVSKAADNRGEFIEILKDAESTCQHCEPTSPTICVETCDIWKTKNEFLEMNGTLCSDNYSNNLLNAVKNDRRQKVVEALSERPRGIAELQGYLRENGYYHSRRTIADTYVEPLKRVGLVKNYGNKYKLTVFGRKFEGVLSKSGVKDSLPSNSNCYEEIVLRTLEDGPKTYANLAEFVPQSILSRSLQRLAKKAMVTRSESPDHVFYFKTKRVPKKQFTLTEKKVYDAVPEAGISASELSEKVDTNLRRTYKYLRRLRRRRLVFTRKRPRTYELTPSGREVADFLEATTNLVSDASKASTFLLEQQRQGDTPEDIQSRC
jgi:predicted transcriptional regulator